MFEFCEKCGSILVPSKKNEKDVLICKLCKNVIPLDKDLRTSYIYSEELDHPESVELEKLKEVRH